MFTFLQLLHVTKLWHTFPTSFCSQHLFSPVATELWKLLLFNSLVLSIGCRLRVFLLVFHNKSSSEADRVDSEEVSPEYPTKRRQPRRNARRELRTVPSVPAGSRLEAFRGKTLWKYTTDGFQDLERSVCGKRPDHALGIKQRWQEPEAKQGPWSCHHAVSLASSTLELLDSTVSSFAYIAIALLKDPCFNPSLSNLGPVVYFKNYLGSLNLSQFKLSKENIDMHSLAWNFFVFKIPFFILFLSGFLATFFKFVPWAHCLVSHTYKLKVISITIIVLKMKFCSSFVNKKERLIHTSRTHQIL